MNEEMTPDHVIWGAFLAFGRRTVKLTKEQCRLLDLYLAASDAEPEAAFFTCLRMERIDFVWIIHPGLYNDVRMAHWDDMLELDRLGLIEIHLSDHDSQDCSFCLTPIAAVVHADCKAAPQGDEIITVSIDADA